MRLILALLALTGLLLPPAVASVPISVGGLPVTGRLEAGDAEPIPPGDPRAGEQYLRDGYTFEGRPQDRVQINLESEFDGYLMLLGPGDVVIAQNDDFGSTRQSRIEATLTTRGTHRVIVTSFSSGTTGQYTLAVAEPPAPPAATGDERISIGQSVRGELTPEDNAELSDPGRGGPDNYRDGYRFRARANQAVLIELICSFDGYLFLCAPNGGVIASNDDWGTTQASRITATLAESGTYRIVVTSFSPRATGSYTLSLLEAEQQDLESQDPWSRMMMDGMPGTPPPTSELMPPGVDPNLIRQLGFHQPSEQRRSSSGGPVALRGELGMHSAPLNVACCVGDVFLTSVLVQNTASVAFDEIAITVTYDPRLLRPLRVSDHKIRALLGGPAALEADLRAGRFCYRARFAQPPKATMLELITVEWEALAPTPRARIALMADGEGGHSLSLDGLELLRPDEGLIGTDVAIRPVHDDRLLGPSATIAPDPATQSQATLALVGPAGPLAVGESFEVDLFLANPKGELVDEVEVALRFDPAVLEIVDAATAGLPPQSDNWIFRGVNLLDAPFHERFPFDRHLRNEADNRLGTVWYHMGLGRARPLPSGAFARIRLRALAPSEATALTPVRAGRPDEPTTAVRRSGMDLISGALWPADLTLRIE